MCVTNPKAINVREPMTVYKAIVKIYYTDHTDPWNVTRNHFYRTPFQWVTIPNEVVEGKGVYEAGQPQYIPGSRDIADNGIGAGYVHAYADLESVAKEYMGFYTHVINKDDSHRRLNELEHVENNPNKLIFKKEVVIYECTVYQSADENYCWEGNFDTDKSLRCVCARRLTFDRQVDEETLRHCARSRGQKT